MASDLNRGLFNVCKVHFESCADLMIKKEPSEISLCVQPGKFPDSVKSKSVSYCTISFATDSEYGRNGVPAVPLAKFTIGFNDSTDPIELGLRTSGDLTPALEAYYPKGCYEEYCRELRATATVRGNDHAARTFVASKMKTGLLALFTTIAAEVSGSVSEYAITEAQLQHMLSDCCIQETNALLRNPTLWRRITDAAR